jgi:hypothetical protein
VKRVHTRLLAAATMAVVAVRGRIEKIRQVSGANGPEVAYDVRLGNGQRGILPPRMVRKPSGK